jgi:hypothetical protein
MEGMEEGMGRLAKDKVAGELRETLWRINAWLGTDSGRPSRRAAPGTSTWTVTPRPSPIPDTFAFVQMVRVPWGRGMGHPRRLPALMDG